MEHPDVDRRELHLLVLLREVGDLVLADHLLHADRARIAPHTIGLLRDVQASEVARLARVSTDDRVGEHRVQRPLERTAQLHFIGEPGDARAGTLAKESRVAEALLELRPVREDAGLHVERSVHRRERGQQDADHDQGRHGDESAFPEIPARIAGELDVRARRVGNRARVVGPQQEGESEHEHRERVSVLVLRHVEEVGRERGGAGDQTQHGFAPAQHAPGKPRTRNPHQETDEKQVERWFLRRGSIGDAVPPHNDKLRADDVARVAVMDLRPRPPQGDPGSEDEADPQPDPFPHARKRKHPHHDGRENRDEDDHIDAVHPLHRRGRAGDGERQQQDQDDRPEAAAAQRAARAVPEELAPVQRALECSLRAGQPAFRRYVSHPWSSRGARSRRPCVRHKGRRPGPGRSWGSGQGRRSWRCRGRRR